MTRSERRNKQPYARWFKCDLQMQTPGCRHWREGRDESLDATRAFLERCYEEGLEVIAVTNHNLDDEGFFDRAASLAKELEAKHGRSLHVFRGFEVQAQTGNGVHVLGLFEAGASVEVLNHRLTQCGVPMPRFQDTNPGIGTKTLNDAIDAIQRGGDGGLAILAHAMSDKGALDDGTAPTNVQAEVWRNPEILACEVSKPWSALTKGYQRLLGNGNDCWPQWKRTRKIACVSSSDCYALGKNESNGIGSRFTWIKMTEPSIEGLRQAFLDPDAKVWVPEPADVERDPNEARHARITRLTVEGAEFLDTHDVEFPPGLACVIGGRGAGKSSILEGIALGLGEVPSTGDASRLGAALANARVTVMIAQGVEMLRFTRLPGGRPTLERSTDGKTWAPADLEAARTVLGVQIFRQGDLSLSTEAPADGTTPALLERLDELCAQPLGDARRSSAQRVATVRDRNGRALRKVELGGEVQRLEAERDALVRAVQGLPAVRQSGDRQRIDERTFRHAARLVEAGKQATARVRANLPGTDALPAPPGDVERATRRAEAEAVEKRVGDVLTRLSATIHSALTGAENTLDALTHGEELTVLRESAGAAERAFEAACREAGIKVEEVKDLVAQEQRARALDAELHDKRAELAELEGADRDLEAAWRELSAAWARETNVRKDVFDELHARVPKLSNDKPIVEVRFEPGRDRAHFLDLWGASALCPDGRGRLGRTWDDLGGALFAKFVEGSGSNAWSTVDAWLDGEVSLPEHDALRASVRDHLRVIKRAEWLEARLVRVRDLPELLTRTDDDRELRLSARELSQGQRNVAMLALLLARGGGGPLLLDQPEDDLDSSFLTSTLIPLLRDVQSRRQVLIVSHNPNIPVNGAADLVYALSAAGGRGALRAQGGLDLEPVRKAVLEIMEGSDRAFLSRGWKYHLPDA